MYECMCVRVRAFVLSGMYVSVRVHARATVCLHMRASVSVRAHLRKCACLFVLVYAFVRLCVRAAILISLH